MRQFLLDVWLDVAPLLLSLDLSVLPILVSWL